MPKPPKPKMADPSNKSMTRPGFYPITAASMTFCVTVLFQGSKSSAQWQILGRIQGLAEGCIDLFPALSTSITFSFQKLQLLTDP